MWVAQDRCRVRGSMECCEINIPVESRGSFQRGEKFQKNEDVVVFNCIPGRTFRIKHNTTQHSIIFYVPLKAVLKKSAEWDAWSQLVRPCAPSRHPPAVLRPLLKHVRKTRTQSGLFQRWTSSKMRHSCRKAKSPGLHSNPWSIPY